MGKLGKKARKFAKKNLQSVLKRKRKLKSVFKRRASKKDEPQEAEEPDDGTQLYNGSIPEFDDMKRTIIDAIFVEDVSDVDEDHSDSDGYLTEEESDQMGETASRSCMEDDNNDSTLSVENKEILSELVKKRNKLDRLKDKDTEFSKFLESNSNRLKLFRYEENEYSDEEESSDDGKKAANENGKIILGMNLRSDTIDTLYQLVTERQSIPALIKLLNGYRAACHYGVESSNFLKDGLTFCNILMFMLREADNTFRKLLGISFSNEKEAIMDLKNSSKWKTVKPLIKSFLRSTLFLLNEVSDSEILSFTLNRLKSSIIFFAAFPALLQRLIKTSVHLWATGEERLSLQSFLLLKGVATTLNSDCYDTSLVEAYRGFIGRCKIVEPVLFKHIEFLKNSFVELCSLHLKKSFDKAMDSIQRLAMILQLGFHTKKKEAVRKLCSWQYANCIELWVAYISVNFHDYDLQPLLFMIIRVINGVAVLFPGPRYLPFRVKCIQWLNYLSSSSGVFIPIASLAMDILEYKIDGEGKKQWKDISFSSSMKLAKHWLKSRNFQESCVFSTIELLAVHFMQWSYHISFPELATIPVIHLRKFHEMTAIESLRRVVKRFIDQVEQNVEFVRKKRDEVAFSPNDDLNVESFMQLEKGSSNTPFMQYYKSLVENSASRNLSTNSWYNVQKQMKAIKCSKMRHL